MESSNEFKWKVLDLWNIPDEGVQLSNAKNFLTAEHMVNTDKTSTLTRFVKYAKSLGFNAIYAQGNPENYPEANKRFSEYLKENGMGYIIWKNWNEYRRGLGTSWPPDIYVPREPVISEKHCPFNPEVRKYWISRIAKDFDLMPGLIGYRMVASESYCAKGAPWNCNCEKCKELPRKERLIAAMKLLGELMEPHNGTVFWETVLDDPWCQETEAKVFSNLTGLIPENVVPFTKETIWDFNPNWPRPPLFYNMNKDSDGKSHYMTQFLISGDYRGTPTGPWSMLEQWSEVFKLIKETGQQGVWFQTVVIDGEYFDHPLNMVNWYGASRFMKNPLEDPKTIMKDWANETFGLEAAPTIIEIIHKMTEALGNVLYYKGLWTQFHGNFFDLEFIESHFCGPYKLARAVDGMYGLELPLDGYTPEVAKKIKEDPKTLAVWNKLPLDKDARQDIINKKEEAIVLIGESIKLLEKIESELDDDLYKYLHKNFEGYKNDAFFWKTGMKLYLDWKLGELTEEMIDSEIDKCRGLKGVMLPDPFDENPPNQGWTGRHPATLNTLANNLKDELRNPAIKEKLDSDTKW